MIKKPNLLAVLSNNLHVPVKNAIDGTYVFIIKQDLKNVWCEYFDVHTTGWPQPNIINR